MVEMLASLHRLAQVEGVEASVPLLEPAVLSAIRTARGGRGWVSRSEAMMDIAQNRLPHEVLTRRSKAEFAEAFWGPRTRAFVEEWTGTGVDRSLVDIEALRTEWRAERPDFHSMLLLQEAWLHQR
jgi:asparagine synthase (glutamine-hydrolysing)